MPSSIELCIVMPAYNEEGCIAAVVAKWIALLRSLGLSGSKLIIVNDGSRDNTGKILDEQLPLYPELQVIHQKNGGHGAALRHAYEAALTHDPLWVFQTDSDDQFEPTDFKVLWDKRDKSKFIMGRRYHRHDPLHRLVITRILRALNIIYFGVYLTDSNIPYRLIKGSYLKALLGQVPPGVFAPNIFIAVLAAKDGQDVMAIPVQHKDRRTGKISIVRWNLLKACMRCARELFDFRLQLGSKLRDLRASGSDA